MRNLKKILALVLALMMVLSVMVFASAANYDDYSDKDQVSPEYAEAVEVLTGMDIFWGSENSFYPKSNVTRAEVATLLYRIMTGDITGSQVGIYKDYGMFDDVLETNWFAGYVNYAANGELVVGVGDNKYNPKGNVTGYEWITMLLRAIGYDANGEISGSTWKITAASQAKESGILGSFNEATLNSALTREQVAYLLFNAIQARKVNYTNAFGYRPSSLGYTIAWDMFRLAKTGTISVDAWGRPGYYWYADVDADAAKEAGEATYATIEEAPVKTYNTAVTECDVASAVDIKTSKTYDAWYNGNQVIDGETIVATATTVKIGGQGMLTEVYKDRIVFIDTFLASVKSVANAKFDAAGHLASPATLVLTVYDGAGATTDVRLTNGATNYTYSVGQYLLVNAETEGAYTTNIETSAAYQYVEIVGVATSIVGSQSKIWWNEEKHTIGGTDYNDAIRFYLDQAGIDQTANHSWLFDQYGNLIGAVDIISTNYAVLKNIQWIPVTGSTGYAQATLVDLSGNESTVKVRSIDGDAATTADMVNDVFGAWDADNFAASYTDNAAVTGGTRVGFSDNTDDTAYVSNELLNNVCYQGYAMYRVDTNLDGYVSLQGFEGATTIVNYADNVNVVKNASAIRDAGNNVVVHVSDNTQFLVKGVGNTYTSYTGTANIPTFTNNSVELFYVDVNRDNIAEYVYIKDGTLANTDGMHVLYVTESSYSKMTTAGTYVMENVILDGQNAKVTVANVNVANLLAAGKGKTFAVDFTNGVIANTADVTLSTAANAIGVVAPSAASRVIYLGDDVTVSNNTMVSEYANVSYRVDGAVVCGQNVALTTDALDGYGVWVVYTAGVYNTVSHVYVGTALNEVAAANVYLNGAGTALTGYTVGGTARALTYALTVTGPTADNANLTATALFRGTLGTWANQNDTYGNATTGSITVTSESGSHTATYNITRQASAPAKTQAVTSNWSYTFNSAIVDEPTCYQKTAAGTDLDAVKAALANAKTVSLADITPDGSSYTIKLTNASGGYYTIAVYTPDQYADAQKTLTAGTTPGEATWTGTLGEGYYIVVGGATGSGTCTYYEAFHIVP